MSAFDCTLIYLQILRH